MGVITQPLNKQIFFLFFLLLSVIQYTAQQLENTLDFKNTIGVMMSITKLKLFSYKGYD